MQRILHVGLEVRMEIFVFSRVVGSHRKIVPVGLNTKLVFLIYRLLRMIVQDCHNILAICHHIDLESRVASGSVRRPILPLDTL